MGEREIHHTFVILNEEPQARVKDLVFTPKLPYSFRFFAEFILSNAEGLRMTAIICTSW